MNSLVYDKLIVLLNELFEIFIKPVRGRMEQSVGINT